MSRRDREIQALHLQLTRARMLAREQHRQVEKAVGLIKKLEADMLAANERKDEAVRKERDKHEGMRRRLKGLERRICKQRRDIARLQELRLTDADRAAEVERYAIVVWLRDRRRQPRSPLYQNMAEAIANAIKRGAHLEADERKDEAAAAVQHGEAT